MDDIIFGIGDEVLISFVVATLVLVILIKISTRLIVEPCHRVYEYIRNHFLGERQQHGVGDMNQDVPPEFAQHIPRDHRDPCPICLAEPPRLALETNCGHVFCGSCLSTYWEMGHFLSGMVCPLCRQQVTMLFISFNHEEIHSEELANERRDTAAMSGLYNRQNSGLPRSWRSYLTDWPILMRHLWREFFSVGGLVLMFRIRIIMCFLAGITYLISPLDIIPEEIFGLLGLLDDLFVLFLLAVYITIMYRRLVVTRGD